MIHIRPATPSDRDAILSIATTSGLFSADEVAFFAANFDAWAPGEEARLWLVTEDLQAAAQVAPEPMSDAVWNLLFVATRPDGRRHGRGRALIAAAEDTARVQAGRLMLIDTTSTEDQAPARKAYAAMGYEQEAVIRDYYGDGADRVTFRKRL